MFNLKIDYPSMEEEIAIVKGTTVIQKNDLQKVLSKNEILDYQNLVLRVPVAKNVIDYAVRLVSATRPNQDTSLDFIQQWVDWGAGPRASQYLILGAKARAVLQGRATPDIEDVKALAPPIMRHRILPNFNAEAEGVKVDDIVSQLIDSLDS